MLKGFKFVFYRVLGFAGMDRLLIHRLVSKRLIPILNLHRVSPESNPYWPPMAPPVFEGLLQFLATEFEFLVFGETPSGRRPPIILSFDDGYSDFAEHACPIMEKYHVRANLNVIPECVIAGTPFWNVSLYDFLASAPLRLLREITLEGFASHARLDSERGKMLFGLQLSSFLKKRSRAERESLWEQLTPYMNKVEKLNKTRMLNKDEVVAIARLHQVGAHSFRHDSMRYESDDFFREDVQSCKKFFQQELALDLNIYAFPNGEYRGSQLKIATETGIEHVLVVDERLASSTCGTQPRLTIYGETVDEARFLSLGLRSR
jgi:peptidoglycan/xylan/chitin deacetylase (PgdA/CDA1 family)